MAAQVIYLNRNASDSARVSLRDEASPYLRSLIATYPKAARSALKSLGWWLRGHILTGMQTSAPGGMPLKPLSTIQRIQLMESVRGMKARKRPSKFKPGSHFDKFLPVNPRKAAWLSVDGGGRKPYGPKMPRAVRYNYDGPTNSVYIGWLNPSSASFARALQGGWRGDKHKWQFKQGPQPVTEKMRKFFAMAGIFFRRGKVLSTPERPVIDPVLAAYRQQIPGYIEEKIAAWVEKTYGMGRIAA